MFEKTKEVKKQATILAKRTAMSGMWAGFLVFLIILFVYGALLNPFIGGFVGPLFTPLGAFAQIVTFLIVALITYYIYAFAVRRTGADPETE